MKNMTPNSSGIKTKSSLLFLTQLLAGAMFFSPDLGIQRCAADPGFPTSPTNEVTLSIGSFQIVVDPSFAFLLAPSNSSYYPGYSPSSGVLTSPVMYDSTTAIGLSASHVRDTSSLSYFPVTVGNSILTPFPPIATVVDYGQYVFIPPIFDTAPSGPGVGVDELCTEIESLNLTGYIPPKTNASCSDPRVPTIPSQSSGGGGNGAVVSVTAGPLNIIPLPGNLRCLGMVQEITANSGNDFPAQSFFNMFVRVNLPQSPGSVAGYVFPSTGAVLYNDASQPLIVENLSLTNLPPTVVYTHSAQSTAVPIKFLTSNPPYWTAGEVFGYLTLAGHGVFSNATTVTVPVPCLASAPGGLLDQTLGPIGSPLPGAPIAWLRTTNSFPTPGSSYNSLVNTFVDPSTGINNVLDDTVSFPNGTTTNYIRDFSLGNLGTSIAPPSQNNSAIYSSPSTVLNCELSVDGMSWNTSTAGGALTININNTTGIGSTSTFDTEMSQLDIGGGSLPTEWMIRESPTLQSLGKHTIASDPRGYRVSSFFDVFLELSTDGGNTWIPANRSIRVQASLPPAAPNSIYVTQSGNSAILKWQNSFTLQSTTNLKLPFTDVAGPVTDAPYTNVMSGARFFRLRQ
jgi:hypothetical protein